MIYPPNMTLRDWFAGLAMQGMLSDGYNSVSHKVTFMRTAYLIADAMLEEREKNYRDEGG